MEQIDEVKSTDMPTTPTGTTPARWCQQQRATAAAHAGYPVAVANAGPNRAARRKQARAGRLRLTKPIVTKASGRQYMGNYDVTRRGMLSAAEYIKRGLQTHAARLAATLALKSKDATNV